MTLKRDKQSAHSLRVKRNIKKELYKGRYCYLLFLPVLLYFILFIYLPMFGIVIAFQDYVPSKGFLQGNWVGFKHFISFFEGVYFKKVIWNAIWLNILRTLWCFPFPVIFALMLNEMRSKWFKKSVQTISYLPHFISLVVMVGIILDFTAERGIVNNIISIINPSWERRNFMMDPGLFRSIYVGTDLWQEFGWSAVIYLAAIAGINTELYEAATVDGANRWERLIHVTIPQILPTVVITLLLNVSHMMTVGQDKILLMQNDLNTDVSEVISTYVYKRGIKDASYSFATAVDLFNTVVNVTLVMIFNQIAKKLNETSLW